MAQTFYINTTTKEYSKDGTTWYSVSSFKTTRNATVVIFNEQEDAIGDDTYSNEVMKIDVTADTVVIDASSNPPGTFTTAQLVAQLQSVFPKATGNAGTGVTLTGTQTLTNKTLTAPVINNPTGITADNLTETATRVFVTPTQKTSIGTVPINSTIVFLGDSITENGKNETSTSSALYSRGYAPTANFLSGCKFTLPIGGNLGVGGNTTTQMLARISSVLALNPKVAIVLGGANDIIGSTPAATIISNLSKIYHELNSIGCKVAAVTIMPQFGSYLPSSANETIRQTVRAWQKSIVSENILVGDAEGVTSDMLSDGLHPNALGGQYLGGIISSLLNGWTSSKDQKGFTPADTTLVTNPYMTGTGGTPNTGVTGTVATSWILDADNAGGATLAGSKSTETDGSSAQIITLSGSYNGTTMRAALVQNTTTAGLAVNDIVEGSIDFEIVSANANILGVYYKLGIWTASFASQLATIYSLIPFDGTTQFPVGRYQSRTPQIKIVGGTPAAVKHEIFVLFKDTASPLSVSGVVKIYSAGARKAVVPVDYTIQEKAQVAANTSAIAALGGGGVADTFLLALAALGSPIKAQSIGINFLEANTSAGMVDGNGKTQAVYLPTAQTITGIAYILRTAGVFTADQVNSIGLFTYNVATGIATKVAETTNDATYLQGTVGMRQLALTAPYSAAAGLYIISFLYNSSAQTTAPGLGGGVTLNAASQSLALATNGGKLTGNFLGTFNAQPSTIDLGTIQTATSPLWAGLY